MQYGHADTIEVRFYLIVPEPKRAKILACEMTVACRIALGFRVLAPIHLDDQPRLEAHEIQDIAVEWYLTLEVQSFELLVAECLPQKALCVRGIGTHLAVEDALGRLDRLAHSRAIPSLGFSMT